MQRRVGLRWALAAAVLLQLAATSVSASALKSIDPCVLEDYERNIEYDLEPFFTTSGRTKEKYVWVIEACSATSSRAAYRCGDIPNACLIDAKTSSKPKTLGRLVKKTVLSRDLLQLNYVSASTCSDGKDESTTLLLECDADGGAGYPELASTDGCHTQWTWVTNLACQSSVIVPTSAPPKKCGTTDAATGARYDLAPLARRTGNYRVDSGDIRYWINVCEDVHLPMVGAGYSVAMTKGTDASFVRKMGRTTSSSITVKSPGQLEQVITGGQTCDADDDQFYSAVIRYECGADAGIGSPAFVEVVNSCRATFVWRTAAACAAATAPQTCSTVDATTGVTVDLSSLTLPETSPTNWEAASVAGDTAAFDYFLNVCADLVPAHNPCRAGTSICQVPADAPDSGRSLGGRGKLVADDGEIVMRFNDGDRCSSGARATVDIVFQCDPAQIGAPRLLSAKDDCQFLFWWKTSAACEGGAAAPTQPAEESEGGLSAGAIAAIVMSVLIVAYFGFGAIYLKFAKGEEGIRVVPHWDLFVAAYYTIAQCCTGSHRPPTGAIQI